MISWADLFLLFIVLISLSLGIMLIQMYREKKMDHQLEQSFMDSVKRTSDI